MTSKSANTRQTRQQLIDVGADLLCRHGYTGFSYQDLAHELGIRKPSVHHYFAQKTDLGLALYDWTEQWLRAGKVRCTTPTCQSANTLTRASLLLQQWLPDAQPAQSRTTL